MVALPVDYHGHTLQDFRGRPTPVGWIPMKQACPRYLVGKDRLWRLIDRGLIRAALGIWKRRSRGEIDSVLVHTGDLRRVVAGRGTVVDREVDAVLPKDGERVNALAKEFDVRGWQIRHWLDWDPHPALGRKINSGVGPYTVTRPDGRAWHYRGLLASRADVCACVEALRNPSLRLPGQPGRWVKLGEVFRHDSGRRFFTARYIYAHHETFGIAPNLLTAPYYRKWLEEITVPLPGVGSAAGRWGVAVYSEDSLLALVARRRGEADGGLWFDPGMVWEDAEGQWYTSKWIAQATGRNASNMWQYLRSPKWGMLTHFKKVPGTGRGDLVVHHGSEVHRLIDPTSTQPPPAERSAPLAPSVAPESVTPQDAEAPELPAGTVASDYMASAVACAWTGLLLPAISRLCRNKVIRFWKPSRQRLFVHRQDLADYMEALTRKAARRPT